MIPGKIYPANVLLGVDGSDHALAGIDLLKELPCLPASRVRVVSVWSSHSKTDQAHLEASLQQACDRLSGGCAEVRSELLSGHPAELLLKTAGENQTDLILLGAKGLRATLGILLGGVAQQVVEHAPCPVMVMRAPFGGLRQVLLAMDGSETGQRAAEYLAGFSLPSQTTVHVCHVVPPLMPPELFAGTWLMGHEMAPVMSDRDLDELDKLYKEDCARGEALLKKTVQTLQAHGLKADSALLNGDAATEILKYAWEKQVDLIAAGSRGLSEMRGWLMGSVSRKLVNFAACSVLVVKTPGG